VLQRQEAQGTHRYVLVPDALILAFANDPLAVGVYERYGADQLLIWQARASRVKSERPYGITPAYYHACAARATSDAYRPRRHTHGRDILAKPTAQGCRWCCDDTRSAHHQSLCGSCGGAG
jgi:hypothetical protein